MSVKYLLQGLYNPFIGFETIIEFDDKTEANERLKDYNKNEPCYNHRILEVVKNERKD